MSMPRVESFIIDGHQMMVTPESLSLSGDQDIIGCYFDSKGNIRTVARRSLYGELLLKAVKEKSEQKHGFIEHI